MSAMGFPPRCRSCGGAYHTHEPGCELHREEEDHSRTIDQRDRAEEWADRLAYAIAAIEVIGEHSNLNNPWANALDQIDRLWAQIDRLRAELGVWREDANRLAAVVLAGLSPNNVGAISVASAHDALAAHKALQGVSVSEEPQ